MKSGKWYLLHTILLTVAAGSLIGTGCRKSVDFDNNNVIRTPYGLYFSDKLGAMYNTNDGKSFKLVFPTDGVAARSIITSGNNLLWIKTNLHVSENNGSNFNPAKLGSPAVLVTPMANERWQSMMLNVPSHNTIYVAATPSANGVIVSKDNGETWEEDNWGTFSGLSIQSFTQLKNGNLYALDNNGPEIYERLGAGLPWSKINATSPLPAGKYFLSHFNNALVAADANGAGIFYSNDGGMNWASYAGIPGNQEIYSVAAPLEQVLLAGTDSAGVYRLVGNTFQPSNNGLEPFTKVYGIVGKQDTYKNNVITQFVYIATSKGLFRSDDLGQNWTLVRPGDIRAIY